MGGCLFCRIGRGEVPAERVYEDDEVLGFRDLNPKAPVHVLIIPRRHVETLDDLGPEDGALVGRMYLAAQRIARDEGVAQAGYRTVINCNRLAGQSVFHLHLHLLAGRLMGWPPG